jgi:arsenate reductase-like glutaredoxin family protein
LTVVIDPKKEDLTPEEIEQIKEYHRKKLRESIRRSEESLRDIPELEEPTDDQKEWVLFRLSHSNTWSKVHENTIGDSKNWQT